MWSGPFSCRLIASAAYAEARKVMDTPGNALRSAVQTGKANRASPSASLRQTRMREGMLRLVLCLKDRGGCSLQVIHHDLRRQSRGEPFALGLLAVTGPHQYGAQAGANSELHVQGLVPHHPAGREVQGEILGSRF